MTLSRALIVVWVCGAGGGCGGNQVAPPPFDYDASVAPRPPSCESESPGAGHDCGLTNNDDCCASPAVEGGSTPTLVDPEKPQSGGGPRVTVSSFRLDKYEITVGRFRQFLNAYPGSRPKPGDGAHPAVPGSGWQTTWPLPPDAAGIRAQLNNPSGMVCLHATWTDTPGPNEHQPITCASWFLLFAFCAWDGGRLPTLFESQYVAVGGDDLRVYPWSDPPSSTAHDDSFAVFSDDANHPIAGPGNVGSRPKGASRWGQLDLLGNVDEYLLDFYALTLQPWTISCTDCAELGPWADPAGDRSTYGGGWDSTDTLDWNSFVEGAPAADPWSTLGGRCARSL